MMLTPLMLTLLMLTCRSSIVWALCVMYDEPWARGGVLCTRL